MSASVAPCRLSPCAYSSSAEYDAALIAERRAAGVYGPKRHRKRMLATAAGLAVIIFLIG